MKPSIRSIFGVTRIPKWIVRYAEKGELPTKKGYTDHFNEKYTREHLDRYNFTKPEDAQTFITMFNDFKDGYQERKTAREFEEYQDRERRKEFRMRL
jgi:hypothetical protein